MMFMDTSYLAAMVMENDQWRARALSWNRTLEPPLVTTDYVLLEWADGLCDRRWRQAFVRAHQELLSDPDVSIVPQSRELFQRGLAMYTARSDKDWSLTDCLSFEVMQDLGCVMALSSDIHFIQAGFRALLREA